MSKRGRAAEWVVRFEDVTRLKHVVEAAAAIMPKVAFQIRQVGGYYMLHVDGSDVGVTCCVSARLRVDKVTFSCEPLEEFSICLDTKDVLCYLDSPSCARAIVELTGYHGDASVMLRLQDPDQMSATEEATLNTFVDNENPAHINTLNFDVTLEIDLVKLKEFIKKSHKAHAEKMSIEVYKLEKGYVERSLVVFAFDGSSKFQQKFCHETTKNTDGSLLVRAAPDGNDCFDGSTPETKVFHGCYPIDRIEAFIKTLNPRLLTARAMTGMPLLLEHKLGSDEESHVRFLVASIQDED
jgi:hypothetical protein